MRQNLLRILETLVLPACFFAWLFIMTAHVERGNYDPDEGVNLMKALLVSKGYHLFREIWSDQPPVFTYILAGQFAIFGANLKSAGLLIMALSSVLIWCMYQTARQLEGAVAAITITIFIAASHRFIELSCAVMIGLPAITLGVASVWMAARWRKAVAPHSRWAWLLGSAALMALSAQTKLFTLTLLPGIFVLLLAPAEKSSRSRLQCLGVWVLGVIVVASSVAVATGERSQQLLAPHLREEWLIKSRTDFADLFSDAVEESPYLVPLAVFGLGSGLYRRRWQVIAPALWLITTSAALTYHRPLRPHYVPLLTLPLCWLAAAGVQSIFWAAALCYRSVEPRAFRAAIVLILLSALLPLLAQAGETIQYETKQVAVAGDANELNAPDVVTRLETYKSRTHWIFADWLIYPFRAGLIVPPELAVITEKRIATGFLSDHYLSDALKHYRPEQILIGRFSYGPEVSSYIDKNYHLAGSAQSYPRQYLREN